jgi:hypothetical protein
MADVASRSFHIVWDASFLTHFSSLFPLPQSQSWTLVPLMPELISLVILTLGGQWLPLQRWMTNYRPKIGMHGWNSAPMRDKTHTSSASPNPFNSNSLSVSLQGCGAATMAEEIKSMLRPQKPPSVTYLKPSSWLNTPALGDRTAPKTLTCRSPAS